jgi:predicted cupin superfamily sugar epimerase
MERNFVTHMLYFLLSNDHHHHHHQIEVVDVMQKSQDMINAEILALSTAIPNPKSSTTSLGFKKTDFEKFSLIAPRRGGFMSLFHLHTSTRFLLSSIVRTFMPSKESASLTGRYICTYICI